jgi:2C-methyl-D-erythritol 2,4-cyclodiphosphate synthase
LIHAILDLLEAAAQDGDIQIEAVFPKIAAFKSRFKSADIAKLARIAILSTIYEKGLKAQFEYL